jgi:hypothetical protein
VTIRATPQSDTGFSTELSKHADIHLVPQVDVAADSPIPFFTFAPFFPSAGDLIVFDATASTAASGRSIVDYTWNWGDGEAGVGVFEDHDWPVPGVYTVVLTVTDSAGVSASAIQAVTVN